MLRLFAILVNLAGALVCFRRDLILENLALRQQLAVLTQWCYRRRLAPSDRIFWVFLRRYWPRWKQALLIVRPETVIRWPRTGPRLYWKWISRKHAVVGRKPTSRELREVIFRMVVENCTWGAPRIPLKHVM